MKKTTILVAALLFAFVSCDKKQENKEMEVHNADEHMMQSKKLDVKVVNESDPVCGMSTAEFLSDTIQYNGEIYGFCSETCKNEFEQNPEKYLKK